MKKARRHIDVNLVELDQVLDSALEAPLSESDHGKLKDTLHALAALLVRSRNTEKTSEWLGSRKTLNRKTAGGQRATAAWPRPQWSGGVWWCAEGRYQAPEADPRRPLPGVRQRQCVRAEGAKGAGAESSVRRRWRLQFTHSNGCAVAPAGRCSRHRSRKEWGRISTMKRPRR